MQKTMSDPINSTITTARAKSPYIHSSGKLTDGVINKALFLLGLSSLEENKKEKLKEFIKKTYATCNCVVICQKIGDNKYFLDNLGINIGHQEVLITKEQKIFYTKNYIKPPTAFEEISIG